mmetsp:Transcript_8374/g.25009  ORF Transcript_8374/g.25009 Transcript_8374/m.25009 type:complete len:361 (-) Transcript_8374:107-1189(-)
MSLLSLHHENATVEEGLANYNTMDDDELGKETPQTSSWTVPKPLAVICLIGLVVVVGGGPRFVPTTMSFPTGGPDCVNSPTWSKKDNTAKNCNWVKALPNPRCTVRGPGGPLDLAKYSCRASCGCPDVPTASPTATSAPTATSSPTSAPSSPDTPATAPPTDPTTTEPTSSPPTAQPTPALDPNCAGCTESGCVCQGTAGKGCDQRHCQDARLIRCDAGFCDQSGATTKDPGYAPVDDAGSILCDGGSCDMTGAQSKTFFARMACDGGNCGMRGAKAETFTCEKGGCDYTGITGPVFFAPKQTSYTCDGGYCCLPDAWSVTVNGNCGGKKDCAVDATKCKSCSPRASGCLAPHMHDPHAL